MCQFWRAKPRESVGTFLRTRLAFSPYQCANFGAPNLASQWGPFCAPDSHFPPTSVPILADQTSRVSGDLFAHPTRIFPLPVCQFWPTKPRESVGTFLRTRLAFSPYQCANSG